MSKNYYDILGVDKTASQDEIKKAFRKKAHQYHPDKKDGDEVKFKELNEAYQVLNNKEKRSQYDQFGQTFNNAGGMGGGQGGFGSQGFNWQDFARQAGGQAGGQQFDFDLGDLFGDLFGGGGRSRRARTGGEDIQTQMTIDFQEAVFGVEKIISLEKLDTCDKCDGSGNEPGSKIITCPECKGSGQVQRAQRTMFGVFSSASVCPTCKGQGKKPETFCTKCHGQGRVKSKKELKITIPAGIDNGQTIKISGQGNAGPNGSQAGDLYISFNVKPDYKFERRGYDIFTEANINISQAALGDKVQVNTLDGLVNLKIPAGTQSGKMFVLKNKGVPVLNASGRRGDQHVQVNVEIPTRLSRKQKKLLEELGEEL